MYVNKLELLFEVKWDKNFTELNIDYFTDSLLKVGVNELVELGLFHFNILVNMPINVAKENTTLYLQFEFVNWILSLPQLKVDELLKYKLYVVP